MRNVMDVRVRDRYIEKGRINLEEVAKATAELPDLAENCEWIDYEKEFLEGRDENDPEDPSAPGQPTSGFAPAPPNPGSLV